MAQSTNIFVTESGNYIDISNVFNVYESGTQVVTQIYKAGVDIGTFFNPYIPGGIKANSTNIYLSGLDLVNKFNKKTILNTTNLTNQYEFITYDVNANNYVKNKMNNTYDLLINGSSYTYNATSKKINLNGSYLSCSITIKSISIWYKKLNQGTGDSSNTARYLVDGRPSVANSWIYRYTDNNDIGTIWKNCYFDGGSNTTPVVILNVFNDNTWHNVTYTIDTSDTNTYSSSSFKFGANASGMEPMIIDIAVILVYNSVITQEVNSQNYIYYYNKLNTAGVFST